MYILGVLHLKNIRSDEIPCVMDAPINMGLGREVHDNLGSFHGLINDLAVADIPFNEPISSTVFLIRNDIVEVLRITSVGELIQIDYFCIGMLVEHVPYEVAPDEAHSAGY